MKLGTPTFVTATLALGLLAGCAQRTTTVHRVDETVRTQRPEAVPPPPPPAVEESTTTIRRSHTRTEEDDQ
jgi:type IV pilus biogenesis protein CpaD/CtpE